MLSQPLQNSHSDPHTSSDLFTMRILSSLVVSLMSIDFTSSTILLLSEYKLCNARKPHGRGCRGNRFKCICLICRPQGENHPMQVLLLPISHFRGMTGHDHPRAVSIQILRQDRHTHMYQLSCSFINLRSRHYQRISTTSPMYMSCRSLSA